MKKKKIYEAPTMDVVWLNARFQLLAGSNTNDGYGEAIPEGDDGWHD